MATTTTTTTISPDGSLLRAGSSGSLVTAFGTWTFGKTTASGGNVILLNGKSAKGGSGVMLEVVQGQLYAYSALGTWYKFGSGGWTAVATPNVVTVGSAQLTVAENAGATPIKITAPTDSVYSAGQLKVTVTGLPSDGTVLLSDGTTAVTNGQVLTVTQLTGLQFKPTANLAAATSNFTYTVSDPSGAAALGSVSLAINGASPSADGSLLQAGSSGSLATAAGVWTFSSTTGAGGYNILLNGQSAGGGSAKTLEVASQGQLYAYNTLGDWYEWLNGGWTTVSSPNLLKVGSSQLTVSENAVATPIKITAPTDSVYSAAELKVAVTGLPNDGTILLSDGKTAVTSGQVLTVSQLTGLQFKPTANLASASSNFTYTVSDPSGTSASGTATLTIGAGQLSATIALPAGYSSSQLVGEDKFTTSSLDSTKWSPWLGQNGGRWNGGSLPLPAPYSTETMSWSPYNGEYYDPYPYAYATNTTGNHLVGGNGLQIIASPSSYFSSVDSDYKWASATISSTGHSSMILPATGGYVQVVAKIPDCKYGAWPFIWLLGEGSNSGQNVDWEFGYSGSPNSEMALGINDKSVAAPIASVDLSQDYHTYGTKYVPGQSFTFYLDGNQVASAPTTNTGAFEVTLGLQMATSSASGWHTVSDPVNHPGPYVLSVKDVQVFHA